MPLFLVVNSYFFPIFLGYEFLFSYFFDHSYYLTPCSYISNTNKVLSHLLFCFTHNDIQQLWKEWLHSPHTTVNRKKTKSNALQNRWHVFNPRRFSLVTIGVSGNTRTNPLSVKLGLKWERNTELTITSSFICMTQQINMRKR